MSGSTIGGVVGGVIGFVVTGFNPAGAQWGFMIGSMVGAAVDPDKISAPDGRDAQEQTTTDGIPIPVVYGSPPPFMGTVLDGENKARRIKGEYEDGKGGPRVQQPDSYLWTGAILICEGPIAGVAFIVRNGVLVYDRRENPKITAAETEKFASKIRLYLGTEDQNPDPALEAIQGVGETPYYRGRAYMVIEDDDVTDTAGRIAQYAFGVMKSGETQTVTVSEYAEPPFSSFRNSDWPLVDNDTDYDLVGYMYSSSTVGSGGLTEYTGDSIAEIMGKAAGHLGGSRTFSSFLGFSAYTGPIPSYGVGAGQFGSFGFSAASAQPDITDNASVWLVYNDAGIEELLPVSDGSLCAVLPDGIQPGVFDMSGNMIARISNGTPGWFTIAGYCIPPGAPSVIAGLPALYIKATRKRKTPNYGFGDPCDLRSNVLLPDAPSHTIDCDANIAVLPGVDSVNTGIFRQLSVALFATVDSRLQFTAYPVGPVVRSDDPNYSSQAFWEAAYVAALANGEPIAPGLTFGVDYPVDSTMPVYQYTFSTTTVQPDAVFLADVQRDLAARCDVPSGRIDVADLGATIIPGYMVATPATGANASRGLQPMFFYDMPEVDGAIRCTKRGKTAVGAITADDFVSVEDGDEDIRSQQIEFPKAIHLAYPDPAMNYAITKQTFQREAAAVISIDEQIVSTTIPFDGDTAAKIADVMGKVAWASAEGRIKCTLPREFTLWAPADCFDYNGKRWLITKADYDSYATIKIEALYDRASNYVSSATGKDSRPPGAQTSGLRGPTRFEAVNVSPLLDAQDQLGLYFGVCGVLDTWRGGQIRASADGGVTWRALGTWTNAAVMGHTTTDLEAGDPWIFDEHAEVTVKVHGGEPETATFLQLLNEANGCIIGDEVCQFEEATEVDDLTFRLVGLTRARHGTVAATHPIHSRFVLLNGALNFVELPAAWIGLTLRFHIQSVGTPAGTGYTEAFVWQPANAQTEWPPFHFGAEDIGSATRISWIGRARLGTSASPFHSGFFDGYRITFTDGTTSQSYTTTDQHFDYTDAQRTADFGSLDPLDVAIFALNRITGASPALQGSI